MLIYNFQKEFIGIDEADLEVFGFANLAELKAEADDFADMFIREPGYVHNFKHVHWIDFITCADPSEESKVIIETNGNTYQATVTIDTLYLSDNPTSKAYLINLKSLTLKRNGEFSEEVTRKKPPKIEPTVGHAFNLSPEVEEALEATPQLKVFEPFENLQVDEETPEILDIHEEVEPKAELLKDELIEEPVIEVTLDAPLDISFDDDDIEDSIFAEETAEVETFISDEEEDFSADAPSIDLQEDDGFDYSYNYDPQVASDELGLPIDLIEEFIEDFIAQAKEFKDELHSSLNKGDTDNIKILSHKLKGVAANLRIEDAFNTLSIINTSSDINEVEKYLHIFYKTIAKLSGEKIEAPQAPVVPVKAVAIEEEIEEIPTIKIEKETQEDDDDLYGDDLILDFKEDSTTDKVEVETPKEEDDDDLYLDFDIDIKDSEAPQKIEMPELDDIADIDDLLSIDEEFLIKEEVEEVEEVEIEILPEINYSKELIANEIGLDQESFNEIFDDYIVDSKSSITVIDKAIIKDDFATCKKEAIKLKGMSDNMRVNAFKEELTSLINSSDKDELVKAVKKINAVIAQISK